MATKEDILEQVVEEYLIHQGYFVRHNLKFRPNETHADFVRNQDSNHSDIDVLGFHPLLQGPARVLAVSCKSWQSGFDVNAITSEIAADKKRSGRQTWQGFRELCRPKWAEAFVAEVRRATGTETFTHMTAVTRLKGSRETWEKFPLFQATLGVERSLRIITFREMVATIQGQLTNTLAGTEVGRMLQLFKAANLLEIVRTE